VDLRIAQLCMATPETNQKPEMREKCIEICTIHTVFNYSDFSICQTRNLGFRQSETRVLGLENVQVSPVFGFGETRAGNTSPDIMYRIYAHLLVIGKAVVDVYNGRCQ